MERAQRGSGLGALAFLFFAVAAAAGLYAIMPLEKVANTDTVDEKHAEAPLIRKLHQRGLCHKTEAWISTQRGTLLVLCKMDKEPRYAATWGGLIWRVLEMRNGSLSLLGKDTYECTVFAHGREYWDRVIARDGYVQVHDTRWFGPLQWLIDP